MKITHICLCGPFTEGWGYQQNLLAKYHRAEGHNVSIIASTEAFSNEQRITKLKPGNYQIKKDIPLIRISYKGFVPFVLNKKLRLFSKLYQTLVSLEPDVIFIHGTQFLSILEVKKYAKKTPGVKVFVDSHADNLNSAKGWISKNILHKIIYKYCAKIIEPFTQKFYGTLPIRNEFLHSIYGIPKNKIELLVFGADDDQVHFENKTTIRSTIRKKLNIDTNDFVIITGGKIDRKKNIHLLIQAVENIQKENIKLIVFGTPDQEMKDTIETLCKSKNVRCIGWINSDEVYNYFLASDLAIFPGTHSVLWEQAVGTGIPCIFKRWKGMEHVELNGNCLFLENDTIAEISKKIIRVINEQGLYDRMKNVAETKGREIFSYRNIAKKTLEDFRKIN